MTTHVQIDDDGHMVEDGEQCWCNPAILHRADHEDDIIIHFNVGQDRNLTSQDIDDIVRVVEEYEQGDNDDTIDGELALDSENPYNREKTSETIYDARIRHIN